jgi:hypothetical protein
MTDPLTRTRQEINTLLASLRNDLDAAAAQRAAELDRREAELAKTAETYTRDGAVRAAWRECAQRERDRFCALISRELVDAKPMSPHRTSLLRLSRHVAALEP